VASRALEVLAVAPPQRGVAQDGAQQDREATDVTGGETGKPDGCRIAAQGRLGQFGARDQRRPRQLDRLGFIARARGQHDETDLVVDRRTARKFGGAVDVTQRCRAEASQVYLAPAW
jgi:hypothetical protein